MKKLELIVKPFPISVNTAYTVQRYNRSRRILTKEARQFKDDARTLLEDDLDIIRDFMRSVKEKDVLVVDYVLCRPFLNKGDGKPKKIDSDNFIKLLQDVLFDVMKIDDRMVWEFNVKKVHTVTREPFVFVTVKKAKIGKYLEE